MTNVQNIVLEIKFNDCKFFISQFKVNNIVSTRNYFCPEKWGMATNIPQREKDAQAIIHFHNQRCEFEKMIGELKHNYCLYFTIGILEFTLVQLLKRHYFGSEWKKKSVRSLRYYWLHVPSRIVSHARYTIAKVAMAKVLFEQLLHIYLKLCLAPYFSSA